MITMRTCSIRIRFITFSLILYFSMSPGVSPAGAEDYPLPEYRSLGQGLKYGRVDIKSPPLTYHVLLVDMNEPGIEIRPVRARGRDETIDKMSNRVLALGEPLLAVVNGDYFRPGNTRNFCPWGILVESGELIFSPTDKSAFSLGKDGKPLIAVIDFKAEISFAGSGKKIGVIAINRQLNPGPGECCLFNPDWDITAPEYENGFAVTVASKGKITGGLIPGKVAGVSRMPVGAPIPEEGYVLIFSGSPGLDFPKPNLGESVTLSIELSPAPYQAIGGGPRLVRDGKVSIETGPENFTMGKAAYLVRGRHPRTAVGYTAGGEELIITVVEGRSQTSGGMKMGGLADLMRSLGAWQAMSFDGGRSVGLFLEGKQIVKGQRIICDALGIFRRKEGGVKGN
jgi:Phosphodiester glycosidase